MLEFEYKYRGIIVIPGDQFLFTGHFSKDSLYQFVAFMLYVLWMKKYHYLFRIKLMLRETIPQNAVQEWKYFCTLKINSIYISDVNFIWLFEKKILNCLWWPFNRIAWTVQTLTDSECRSSCDRYNQRNQSSATTSPTLGFPHSSQGQITGTTFLWPVLVLMQCPTHR